jgi:hypothetical protein
MDKKTKLYLGIGLLGLGVYLYFRPSKNMVGLVKTKSSGCPDGWTLSADGRKCVPIKMNASGTQIVFNGDFSMSKVKSFTFTCPGSSTVYTATSSGTPTPGSPRLHGTRQQMIAQACAWIAQHPEYTPRVV